jgi:hypothetical protein
MDLMGFITLLRWPLEIVAFGLALAPLLSVLIAWASLPPSQVLVHFGVGNRPNRRSSRARLWILPVLALVVYGFMGAVSGTWEWAFLGRLDLPAGAEIPLLLKPVMALLIAYANEMFIRVVREQEELPNGWLMSGLTLIMLASPLALSVVTR